MSRADEKGEAIPSNALIAYRKERKTSFLTGRKNKFCARRIAAWLLEAKRLVLDVLAVGGIVSSESLRKNCKENVYFSMN